jgi:hypothetical protein
MNELMVSIHFADEPTQTIGPMPDTLENRRAIDRLCWHMLATSRVLRITADVEEK